MNAVVFQQPAPVYVLSAQELRELTGKKNYAAMARALEFMGIPFRARPGKQPPAVLRIHVETPVTRTATKRKPRVRQ